MQGHAGVRLTDSSAVFVCEHDFFYFRCSLAENRQDYGQEGVIFAHL